MSASAPRDPCALYATLLPFAAMKKTDYVERILAARVYDVAHETPLEAAPALWEGGSAIQIRPPAQS